MTAALAADGLGRRFGSRRPWPGSATSLADLDPLARHDVLALLLADVAERGATLLFSTHLLDDLTDVCDHPLVLGMGEVLLWGPVPQLCTQYQVLTGPPDALRSLAAAAC